MHQYRLDVELLAQLLNQLLHRCWERSNRHVDGTNHSGNGGSDSGGDTHTQADGGSCILGGTSILRVLRVVVTVEGNRKGGFSASIGSNEQLLLAL